MITIRHSKDRGHADHGWLQSAHTFSFGSYYDPDFMAFGPLRVLNQDRVAGGGGFPAHGHANMEIVSYVLEGAMEHRDSMGTGSVMRPGDVQLMSAGTGVQHSEFNASGTEPLHFLQMWVMPSKEGTAPGYQQESFAAAERQGRLRLVVSPDGEEGSLRIGQDARMYAGRLAGGEELAHGLIVGRGSWLHVATGSLEVNGIPLGPGDGAAIVEETALQLTAIEDVELVLWDLPLSR